jgi:hypothetical protein
VVRPGRGVDEIRIADRSGGFRVLRFSMENAGPPTGAQVLLEVP